MAWSRFEGTGKEFFSEHEEGFWIANEEGKLEDGFRVRQIIFMQVIV